MSLANGNFELWNSPTDASNWIEAVGDGSVAREDTEVYAGTYSCKLTGGATPQWLPRILQVVSVTAGRTYWLSFWTRGDGINAGRYRVYDLTGDVPGEVIAQTSTGITGEGWQQINVNFVAPAGSTALQLFLYGPNASGGIVYFDDAVFTDHIGMLPARLLPMLWPESMNLWLTGTGVVADVDSDPIVRRVPSTASTPLRNVPGTSATIRKTSATDSPVRRS